MSVEQWPDTDYKVDVGHWSLFSSWSWFFYLLFLIADDNTEKNKAIGRQKVIILLYLLGKDKKYDTP